jgi:rod shape-determining protein MreC
MAFLTDLGTPPPTGAREGRRRRRTVLALVVLACVTLMILDARRGSPVDPLRSATASVVSPLQSALTSADQPIEAVQRRFADANRLAEENRRLQQENERLQQQLRSVEAIRQRASELDKLLGAATNYQVTPARVIAIGAAQNFNQTVTIDAGTADGVRADMTVLNGDGLVGRVVRATSSTATVLLLGDRNSTVGGRLGATAALGFVSGRGEIGSQATLEYRLVDLKAKPKVGARVLTWGSRGNAPYVPGIPIGEVISVGPTQGTLGSTAVIRPYVDSTRLDTVGVVVGPGTRDARKPLGQAR